MKANSELPPKVVDLFAGGGGVSFGVKKATGKSPVIAVNHWNLAIEVHKKNHPETRHFVADVYKVKPEEVAACGDVWLLWASPDCTHHSVAKGGKPVQQKIRMLPFSVIPWAAKVKPAMIIVENVQELRRWGPLKKGKDGKLWPDPARAGEIFRAWVRKLERLGYVVEHRVLCAADYGVPTSRRRLFVIARRDGEPIVWPEPTHGSPKACAANPKLQPWRTAAECIDWSLPCPSIFDRRTKTGKPKPLKPKTLWRIFKGLQKFVLGNPDPFTVPAVVVGAGGRAGQSHPTSSDDPLGTITGKNDRGVVVPVVTRYNTDDRGRSQAVTDPISTIDTSNRFGLVAPHLVKVNHGGKRKPEERGEQLDLPLSTVTAGRRGHGLVAANLIAIDQQAGGGKDTSRSATDPLHTVVTKNRSGLVTADMVALPNELVAPTMVQTGYGEREGQRARYLDLHQPMGTVVAGGPKRALISAFLAQNFGGVVGQPLGEGRPMPTITARDHNSIAAAALVKLRGECTGADPRAPMPTVTANGNHVAEVRAFLVAYYGQDGRDGQELTEPMRTITAKARLGIVTIHGVDYQIVDIGFRMLRSHELLRATCGEYADEFDLGPAKTEEARVRLIGNMVPPKLPEVLIRANMPRQSRRSAA